MRMTVATMPRGDDDTRSGAARAVRYAPTERTRKPVPEKNCRNCADPDPCECETVVMAGELP